MSCSLTVAPVAPNCVAAASTPLQLQPPPIDIDSQSAELSSAPESLDLVYDDWEGQFEFVGPSTSASATTKHRSAPNGKEDDADADDDELRLSVFQPNSRQPVLYDEETFLSLNPHDFEQPLSLDYDLDSIVGTTAATLLHKHSNIDDQHVLLNNQSGRKFVSAKFHAEELNNIKNRLLAQEIGALKAGGMKANNHMNNMHQQQMNHNNNNNEFAAAELCDNLTEQVGVICEASVFRFSRISVIGCTF